MSANNDYSEEFDRLRRNRVEVSHHKYGPARKNFGEGRDVPHARGVLPGNRERRERGDGGDADQHGGLIV